MRGNVVTRINLLPWREQLREERKKDFLILMGGCVGVSLIIMICVHFAIVNQISTQTSMNAILQQEITILDDKIREIKGLKEQKQKLLARMHIIQNLQE